MPRTLVIRLVAVTLLTLSLAACGGDDTSTTAGASGDGTSTETAAAVPVEEYLDGLCTAVSAYQDELTSLNDDLQGELSGATPEPGDIKDMLIAFLTEVEAATQALAEEVRGLGTPDVDGGEEIATTFVNAFEQVEDLFATSRADVEALSTDDPVALAEGLQEVATNLEAGGEDIASVFDTLPEEDLGVNPEDIPACQEIAS
jgi:hypothetical protein